VLFNGYDPADFPPLCDTAAKAGGPLRLTYAGTLYGGRNPFPLLKGLAQLVSRGAVRKGELEIHLIGDCDRAMGHSIADVSREFGISDFVFVQPPAPYAEALSALSQSDVLLLFAQNQPLQIPAKLYEYLHIGRFILCFADGATAGVVREAKAGRVVESCSAEEAESALAEILGLHRAGALQARRPALDSLTKYMARPLAAKLADVLNEVVDHNDARPPMTRRSPSFEEREMLTPSR
jgi:glycosyltransferase involved in cell wall biosynthesis